MQFSIIIPTLQEGITLERTLQQFSSLRMKYEFEIIVSDGGSADETLVIARQHADVVIKAIPEEKQNIAIGRNRGAEISKGNVLVFLDADILIQSIELFFDRLFENLQCNEVAAITCNVQVYYDEARFVDKLFHSAYNNFFWLLNMIGIGMGRGECQIVLRERFFKVGMYDIALTAGEDFDLFRRLSKFGKILFDRHSTVYESPRRFRKYGYIRITCLWLLNGLSVLFFHKSVMRQWEAIR